jgi:hypothetical protein
MDGVITDLESDIAGECVVVDIDGHTLRLTTPLVFALRACVKVEFGNQMWAGEIYGCEPGAGEFAVEVQGLIRLADLAAVDRMSSRFRQVKNTAGQRRESSKEIA